MTRLDKLIEHARAATVDRDAADRYVRELDRWARPAAAAAPPPRRWPWLLFGAGTALAAAAAAAVIVLRPGSRVTASIDPVRIGPRVALVADPDSRYHVVQADRDTTRIELERGAITVRLWSGAHHRLSLSGLGVTASAIGTIYSLALHDGHPVVHVDEGIVEVRAPDGVHMVRAPETWPAPGIAANPAAAPALLRLPAPAAELAAGDASPSDAGPTDASPSDASPSDAGVADAGPLPDAGPRPPGATAAPRPPAPAAAPPPADARMAPPSDIGEIKTRWRQARLLRGQGKFADALAQCVAIGDARDAIWSPIALVEAVRIALGPLSAPERAVELADRMLHDWPTDPLATEARVLRCRALTQLGRDCNASTGR